MKFWLATVFAGCAFGSTIWQLGGPVETADPYQVSDWVTLSVPLWAAGQDVPVFEIGSILDNLPSFTMDGVVLEVEPSIGGGTVYGTSGLEAGKKYLLQVSNSNLPLQYELNPSLFGWDPVDPAPVPEPASWPVLITALGLFAVVLVVRRRR